MLKMPPGKGGITALCTWVLFAFFILASLVCDSAAGFASRLAGSLAFTAATFSSTCFQVGFIDGIDMFHLKVLLPLKLRYL